MPRRYAKLEVIITSAMGGLWFRGSAPVSSESLRKAKLGPSSIVGCSLTALSPVNQIKHKQN